MSKVEGVNMASQVASTTVGKLQYHRGKTPVPPWENSSTPTVVLESSYRTILEGLQSSVTFKM